jgi:hypothetical protein
MEDSAFQSVAIAESAARGSQVQFIPAAMALIWPEFAAAPAV